MENKFNFFVGCNISDEQFEDDRLCEDGKFRFVYLIRNIVNGKVYVGKHTTKKLDDGYFGSGILLKKAIIKYGKENFEIGFLSFSKTSAELNEEEIYWVKFFKNQTRVGTYNIADGGSGGDLITNHPDRDLLIKNMKGRSKGMKRSNESKERMSVAQKEYRKDKPGTFLGKKHSEETRAKLSELMKARRESVDVWNKGIVGEIKRTRESIEKSSKNNPKNKSIVQFDTNGNFIRRYDYNPKTYFGIIASCKGVISHSGGFIWLFEEEYLLNKNLIKERVNRLNQPSLKLKCPHCNLEGSKANMKRWHFDNCKKRNNE